jgi:hypothetical protein
VPVRGIRKGVPIAGDVLVCDLWMLGREDRVYVHRTDCHSSSFSPLDKRAHRPEYIDITDHTDQLSSIGGQHGRRTNFLLQQDV